MGPTQPHMSRSIRVVAVVVMALGVWSPGAEAQDPSRYGERWSTDGRDPETGRQVAIRVPPEIRQKNTGGSDGAGLCVIASVTTAGRYQGVPGIDRLWEAAKQRPGGYYPEKLEALVGEILPGEKFGSYVGKDTKVVENLVRSGYVVGTTTNTGAIYGGQPIHHMVDTVHLDESAAAIIDNNKPEVEIWTDRSTYDERFVDGEEGWAFVWSRSPPSLGGGSIGQAVLVMLAAGLGAAVAILGGRHIEVARDLG